RLELEHAAAEEALDRFAGLGEHAVVGRELRTLDREREVVGRRARPFAKALRLLGAVEGGIDLDRGELAAGVFELARLRQSLGIERAAPRGKHPAADADPNHGRSLRRLQTPRSVAGIRGHCRAGHLGVVKAMATCFTGGARGVARARAGAANDGRTEMTTRLFMLASAALMSLGLGGAALAQQPPPQSPNMTFFITSTGPGKGADLGGLEGADRQCQTLAQAAGAGSKTWRAYLRPPRASGQPPRQAP